MIVITIDDIIGIIAIVFVAIWLLCTFISAKIKERKNNKE